MWDEHPALWEQLHGSPPPPWRGQTGPVTEVPSARQPGSPDDVESPTAGPVDAPGAEVPTWPQAPEQPITRFAREVLGFTPWPRQEAILNAIYDSDARTVALRLGRRSGKGRLSALIAAYEAVVNAEAHLRHVEPGERVGIVIVATSQAQARIVHRYIGSWLRDGPLASMLVRDTDDELELGNRVVISTMPCTSRSTRGHAVAVLILDELAWFLDSSGSAVAAQEIYAALSPSVAQFPQGRVIAASTPRHASGFFHELCNRADVLEFWATTADMNPTISPAFLASERAADPMFFEREFEARFLGGLSSVFAPEAIREAIYEGEPPLSQRYVVSIDASSGSGKDTFAAMVVGQNGDHLTVRRIKGWTGSNAQPIVHRAVLDEVAELAKSHGNCPVLLDQWASEIIRQGLVERGCTAIPMPWTNEGKETAVLALRRHFHEGTFHLPHHRTLIDELQSLEQQQLPSGRSRYAAPGRGHDDYVTALMAAALHFSTRGSVWGSGSISSIA